MRRRPWNPIDGGTDMDSISTNIAMIKEILEAINSDGVEHRVTIQEQIRDVSSSLTRSLQTFHTQGFREPDARSIAEALLYAAQAFENLVRAEVPRSRGSRRGHEKPMHVNS